MGSTENRNNNLWQLIIYLWLAMTIKWGYGKRRNRQCVSYSFAARVSDMYYRCTSFYFFFRTLQGKTTLRKRSCCQWPFRCRYRATLYKMAMWTAWLLFLLSLTCRLKSSRNLSTRLVQHLIPLWCKVNSLWVVRVGSRSFEYSFVLEKHRCVNIA